MRRSSPLSNFCLLLCSLLLVASAGCRGFGSTPVCLSGARMAATGECESQRSPVHHLPFRDGYVTRVMQGYHGYISHKEDLAYSFDFRCKDGTPITASKGGRVWAVREDSDRGCNDPSCVDDANYIIIDHGDGTYSEYYHLRQMGAIVEVGERVCQGQVIGLCGSTGYSSGPHLHFALTDVTRHTVPVRFREAYDRGYGYPVPETTYRSDNERESVCPDVSYSTLGEDAFAHHGITLKKELPIVVTEPDEKIEVAGRYYGQHPNVAVHRKTIEGDSWTDECIPVDEDGDFRAKMTWPSERFPDGPYWFMITGADKDCFSPGWSWSYKIFVRS